MFIEARFFSSGAPQRGAMRWLAHRNARELTRHTAPRWGAASVRTPL